MRNVLTVFKREFKSYFDSPVAYVFLTAFLALVGFLTFSVSDFYDIRQADLAPFFFWHPWVYLLLVPAATMALWADERRNGTAELLLTLPITVWQALAGKFLAAWAFLGIGLALTFPVAVTVGYLGSPDWGAVWCGYLGSLLLAGAAAAIGAFASSLSRSSVIGFVVSLALVFLLLIIGFTPVVQTLAGWLPSAFVDALAGCSLLTHYESVRRGVVDFADLGYYIGTIVIFLALAKSVIDGRRDVKKGLLGFVLLTVVTIAAVFLLDRLPLRFDLTAERLYTLSDGSKAVMGQLDRDVTLKFYVSSSSSEMPSDLKTYATRVEDLLGEYERAANGHLILEKYDPAPDTDAEEWAVRYGLEPQTLKPFGAPLYFGLVAVCGDKEETLAALSPRSEATLEYDLTRLVTRVAWPERPVIGIMSGLPGVLGEKPNPMMMQMGRRPQSGWLVFSELGKDYDVREIPADAESIDPAVKTLVVVHPKDFTDKALYAIDQFVLRGGRLIACVDPLSFQELQTSNPQMGGMPTGSSLGTIFKKWGVGFDADKVTCDLASATTLSAGRGNAVEEPSFLTLKAENMASDDILVNGFTQLLMPFAGNLVYEPGDCDLSFTPVITTSEEKSSETDRQTLLMGGGAKSAPDGKVRTVAARLEGVFKTAYEKGPDGTNDVSHALSTGRSSVLLVADSDFLTDQVCFRISRSPFGNIAQPQGDNLAFFSNVIELFAGREELIGLRTRGKSARPFDVVDKLEADANEKFQQKMAELEERLQEAQRKVWELQAQKSGAERRLLSKEQQEELVKADKAKVEAQREVRNLRKELKADVESLGRRLKWYNIALVPFLVVLFGLARGFIKRRRS